MGRPRIRRRAHPLRRRGATGPRIARVGAPRCHHGVARHVLAVDRLRQRRGCRRPFQPGRGGAAKIRPGCIAGQQDLVDSRGIRRGDRQPAVGPECQLAAWSFGSPDLGARSRSRHHPRRGAHRRRARQDGRVAGRRSRGRHARHVRDGRGDRQTRRRPLPLPCAAVHLRDVARTPQADQGAAQARPDSAKRAQRGQSRIRTAVLPGQQPTVRAAQSRSHEPAGISRRQVDAVGGTRLRPGHAADELRSALEGSIPAPAGAVRALLRRHRPAGLRRVRCGDRRATPARPAGAQ